MQEHNGTIVCESAVGEGYAFTVSPSFGCGGSIVFDVVDMASSNAPGSYADRLQAFRVTVVDDYGPPVPSLVLDEDFDPNPATGWTHERISVTQIQCIGAPYRDEWRFASKDAAHGSSYHCGTGPGGSYDRYNNAWLYYGGKDSADGPGLVVTPGAMSATLTLVHWYKAQNGADGGQVVVDAVDDNQDTYVPLVPSGGYPGSLASGNCNAQEGRQAFTGNSGGWITSTFDLSKYIGRKIYLAFVFGSDRTTTADEGWYIDRVKVETQTLGAPACDVTSWAGTVPPSVQFTRQSGGTIEASWAASCNGAPSPGQLYSIQSGDLVSLAASGTYSHAAIGGVCSRTSPATFTPGAAQEYYLVVPNLGGREGGAGTASDGAVRPQPDGTCGIRRVEPCP